MTLVLAACDEDPAGYWRDTFQFCGVTEYTIGSTVEAHLESTDCRLLYNGTEYGEFVHYYAVEFLSERTVTVRMDSDEIDPVLIVWVWATGEIVAEDDDGGPGLNARLTRTFVPGRYIIGATSFAAAETGPYTLSSEYSE